MINLQEQTDNNAIAEIAIDGIESMLYLRNVPYKRIDSLSIRWYGYCYVYAVDSTGEDVYISHLPIAGFRIYRGLNYKYVPLADAHLLQRSVSVMLPRRKDHKDNAETN